MSAAAPRVGRRRRSACTCFLSFIIFHFSFFLRIKNAMNVNAKRSACPLFSLFSKDIHKKKKGPDDDVP
jgi:hypothetical protein